MWSMKSLNPRFVAAAGSLFALVGCTTTTEMAQAEAPTEEVGFAPRLEPAEKPSAGIPIDIG